MQKIMRKLTPLNKIPKPVLFIVGFAAIATILLLITKAATPFASIEPESATVSRTDLVVNDTSASGSKAVKFGSASIGTRVCTSADGFPDGNCTGATLGSSLSVVNGDLHITQSGTVSNKDVRGCVYIEANNVTLKNSKISGCTGSHTSVIRNNGNITVVEDVEIDGGSNYSNVDLSGVAGDNITCRRCNIHHLTKGAHFDASNYVFEYSWVHDLFMPGSDNAHGEAIYTDFTNNGIIRGNNLDSNNVINTPNNSATLAVYNLYGGHNNLQIENNLFNADASFCLYVGYTHTSQNPLTNVKVVNNKFGRKYYPGCAYYGPVVGGNNGSMDWGSSNGNVWTNNTYTDGGVIPAP
jgi:hypothetical protein